jgi:hypothetical protein
VAELDDDRLLRVGGQRQRAGEQGNEKLRYFLVFLLLLDKVAYLALRLVGSITKGVTAAYCG